MELQIDVKPSGVESAYVEAPFDVAQAELQKAGYEVISIPENASLRMAQGKDAFISRNGNWTREGVIYVPSKKNYFVRNSPVLSAARKATQAHREGKEFYVTQEEVEEALKDSVEFPRESLEIPTKRLGSDTLAVYAIGGGDAKKAQLYGDFLKEAGIKELPVYAVDSKHVDKQNQPFVRQLWFGLLDNWSDLNGDWCLRYDGGVRGVRSVSAEGSTQKNSDSPKSELYTLGNLKDALNEIGISGNLEATVIKALKK